MQVIKTRDQQQRVPYSNRCLGASLLLTQLLFVIAYGVIGNFHTEINVDSPTILGHLAATLLLALFTIVGFGLLLSSYRHALWLGMLTSLLTVAIGIQAGPLMQKLWFGAFFTSFTQSPATSQVATQIQDFWSRYNNSDIGLNFVSIQTALLSCIGLLVIQTAVIGRASLSQCLRVVSIFEITWNLNYFLNIFINYNVAPEKSLVFDGYGASFLYLYSAAFGIPYALLLPQKINFENRKNEMNRVSMIFGLIGTCMIVATFAFASSLYLSYSNTGNNIKGLNILFALSASIIGTFVGSGLGGSGTIGYREILVGSVSGGVMIASVAPIEDNIGIMIMCGLFAGLISGVYMRTLHKTINRNHIYDNFGLFGPFCINAFIGSFIIAPAVLDRYLLDPSTGSFNIAFLNHSINMNTVGFQLVYAALSVAIGLFSGIFTGLIAKCDDDSYGLYANSRFFKKDYSLYRPPMREDPQEEEGGEGSAKNINELKPEDAAG